LSLLLFNFALECLFRKVQENYEEVEMNGTYELLLLVYDNLLDGKIHKENPQGLLDESKEVQVNTCLS
jgi:hypothetical protein